MRKRQEVLVVWPSTKIQRAASSFDTIGATCKRFSCRTLGSRPSSAFLRFPLKRHLELIYLNIDSLFSRNRLDGWISRTISPQTLERRVNIPIISCLTSHDVNLKKNRSFHLEYVLTNSILFQKIQNFSSFILHIYHPYSAEYRYIYSWKTFNLLRPNCDRCIKISITNYLLSNSSLLS